MRTPIHFGEERNRDPGKRKQLNDLSCCVCHIPFVAGYRYRDKQIQMKLTKTWKEHINSTQKSPRFPYRTWDILLWGDSADYLAIVTTNNLIYLMHCL